MAGFEGHAPADAWAPGRTAVHERRPEENFEEVCEYLPGQPGAYVCPGGLRPLSEAECQDMPFFYGGAYDTDVQAPGPVGCYFSSGEYRFSNGRVPLEEGSEQVPYCKHCELVSMDEIADWSTWSPETAPKVSSRFRRISVGTCQDVGWEPVPDVESCQDATRELGLGLELDDVVAKVQVSTVAERPEGCYQLTDYEAQRQTMWFNTNPYSEGFGAETGEPRVGLLRQPVCQRSGAGAADLDAWSEFYPVAEDLAATEDQAPTTVAVTTMQPQRFRRLLTGNCVSFGGKPVASVDVCESAAKELGLPSFTAAVLPMPGRPEGCYLERSKKDTTAVLWLNPDPDAAGRGTEASEGGTIRSPICEML
jgi:hypothetical protein